MSTDTTGLRLQKVIADFSAHSGMNTCELCNHLGISQKSYQRWVRGEVTPKPASYRKVLDRVNDWYSSEKSCVDSITLYSLSKLFGHPAGLPVVEQYALLSAAGGLLTGYLVDALGDTIATPVLTGLYMRKPEVRLDIKGLDISSTARLVLTVEASMIKCECKAVASGKPYFTIGELTDDFVVLLIGWFKSNLGEPSRNFNYLVKD
jgi:hypothetical protein